MSAIRCVLFDLGGVLVRFRGVERVAAWLGDTAVGETHWRRWLASPAVRDFDLGKLDAEEFAAALRDELGLELTPEEIVREVRGFVTGPLEGALELLDELRPRTLVACLSNTNRIHHPELFRRMGLLERFDSVFASSETGLLKPGLEAFHHAATELRLAPGEILFFDDARLNVEAARALGFEAARVQGPADCRRELERRGLLAAHQPTSRADRAD
jgi:HAD superfamily hydrolase (TIGR01509 family)